MALSLLSFSSPTFPGDLAKPETNGRALGIYYGYRDAPELSSFDLLVLDADHHPGLALIRKRAAHPPIILGYLSLCELGPGRRYAEQVRAAGLVLGDKPDWPGSVLIDIRNPEWQRLIIDEIVPRIFRDGFDGLFLDSAVAQRLRLLC